MEPRIDLIAAALAKAGLKTKGTLEEVAQRLQEHFERLEQGNPHASPPIDGIELATCTQCKFASPASDPACSFCGHEDEASRPAELAEGDGAKKLDQAIRRFHGFSRESVLAGWDAAATLRTIRDDKLYLERRGPKGDVVHTSFEGFCKAELGLSDSHARRLLDVCERYKRHEIAAIGVTKLGLLARVEPGEKHDKLLQTAPDKSARQLAREVRAATSEQAPRTADRIGRAIQPDRGAAIAKVADVVAAGGGVPEVAAALGTSEPTARRWIDKAREEGIAPAPDREYPPATRMSAGPKVWLGEGKTQAPEPKDAGAEPRILTLMAREGEHEVHFYAANRPTPESKPRAKSMADRPRARLRMSNGTEIVIRLFASDKGWAAKVQIREVKG